MICIKNNKVKIDAKLYLLPKNLKDLSKIFNKETIDWLKKNLYDNNKNSLTYNTEKELIVYLLANKKTTATTENYRNLAAQSSTTFENAEAKNILITGVATDDEFLAAAEGLELASYRFNKYFSDEKKQKQPIEAVYIDSQTIDNKKREELNTIIDNVKFARDQVNEPGSTLTAKVFAERIKEKAQTVGISVEILNKKKIESLKMGGVLSVNQGSKEEPVFMILNWNPQNSINKKPIVLVGKGITFDTGGSNLKTERYMEDMKEDMAGGATVAASIFTVAKNQLPIHVIALIPATDNRIGNNSFLPGDIITMHNGKTVEVLNTDAEGRLILADAVSYAEHFDPQLIITMATLTGSAQRATGKYAMVGMGNAEKELQQLKNSGNETFERVVEFPFWDDYNQSLKSDFADLSNLGAPEGGAIIAGKFLEHFTKNPFIHLDIAGVAFSKKSEGCTPAGGTGIGVKLLYHFLKTKGLK